MRRVIFWDTMLFIHLLDSNAEMRQKVLRVFQQSIERNDRLVTSCLAVGEVLAGTKSMEKRELLKASIATLGFELISFDTECISAFGKLRSQNFGSADSVHLACASVCGTDLFLTEDKALHKAHVQGIKFVAGMQAAFPE